MQPSRYRFGIIGFGNRGRGHYRNLTRNFGDRVEVVAVADPRFAREAAGSETPGHVYANYHDLLASPDVDAVVIATHESAHVDASIAAMEAGKVVLLEKAVAPSW